MWSLSAGLRDQIFSQYADVGEIAVALHEIKAVTDDEFIFDIESDIIGIDMAGALFLFVEQNTNADAARIGAFQFLPNGGECVAAVEDVVENENMSIFHVRQRDLLENHFASGLSFPVITGDGEEI